MWVPKFIAIIIIYVIAINLFGVMVGWWRRDIILGWTICVVGGAGVGLVALAMGFAIWILMGSPVS
jgi:hypothetical protein